MKNIKNSAWLIILLLLIANVSAAPKYVAKDPQVVVIGLIGGKAVLRINGAQCILAQGESRDGVTLLGIVDQQARLKINKREVLLGMGMDTGGLVERAAGGSVDIAMNASGQFISNGQINGHVVEFLVDTGANTVSMTTDDARALGIDYQVDGQRGASATAGGVVRAWSVQLSSVQIGPIVVKNVQATVREAPRMGVILLGMTFLSHINLEHDGNRLKMTAR
jgi:aspartyl protease family protein